MGRLIIEGGTPLEGRVKISGAKNEALKVIPLAAVIRKQFKIENVPDISDIRSQLEIFKYLGGSFEFSDNTLLIDGREISISNLNLDIAKQLRASVVYLGPLLARFREVELPFPGGCAIGRRPIDTHLKALADLGAEITHEKDSYFIKFDEFKSTEVTLSEPSVTATENILMFLCNYEKNFILKNCAIEPEVTALIEILNQAGAKIESINERDFSIFGSENLLLDEVKMIPDRIEAFSYLVGFLVTGGSGEIDNFPFEHMKEPMELLKHSGVEFELLADNLTVYKAGELKSFNINTAPYPGFPTDMQSPMSLIASVAHGTSRINETMFENRLAYIDQLIQMGLNAKILNKHEVEITGPCNLKAAQFEALDLRSGITLVLAALAAQGRSVIEKGEIIDRGYENLIDKLRSLGAQITKND